MLMLGTLLLEAAELVTLGIGTDGADEAAIGESRLSPPCLLLGRWFSISASSEVYFRFRLFLVRGSVISDVDDLLASSELYRSIIHGALSGTPAYSFEFRTPLGSGRGARLDRSHQTPNPGTLGFSVRLSTFTWGTLKSLFLLTDD